MKKRGFTKRVTSMACCMALVAAMLGSIPVSAEGMTADDCYAEGYDVNVQLEAEGAVLLKNKVLYKGAGERLRFQRLYRGGR